MSELEFVVGSAQVIDFASGGLPAVLSTPALVLALERTAREGLAPFLEPGEQSLGTEIEIQHLAPTPEGSTVRCSARIVQVEKPLVSFQLEARDDVEVIARGFHRRAVIRIDRFARRVEKKRSR
jgi:predicted thioesterase